MADTRAARSQTTYPGDKMSSTRVIPASPAEIFAVLADPGRHQDTEPGDWVRSAISAEPITRVGQVFSMNMFLEQAGGAYRMDNVVTAFEPDTAISWDPGQDDGTGDVAVGGWRWRYDLAPVDGGTEVTLTYDWSGTTQAVRDDFGGFPVFPPAFLDASLAALAKTVTGRR
ncbi:SRPBCC family protein [Brevibacterium sp. XM4083]|uniref:SRPBCC family protein n=1 Tax=Brevibacterium sp. XM4083 TaxID=2583238 RepID=UPI001126B4F3|nr:SRPBCC family protein [Brevibacterium sp. XM4083]MCM1014193.1 SRPBCC family protein [Brevibacterium sp. XM4083]